MKPICRSFMVRLFLAFGVAAVFATTACDRQDTALVQAAGSSNAKVGSDNSEGSGRIVTLAAGTPVHVRLQQTIDTKRNRAGDPFAATLDEPLVAGDRVAVPRGTPFEGHVITSKESGRFKGRAVLSLSLDSFNLGGVTYQVNARTPSRVSAGHKKRNWLWIGGGSGTGAAIGAIASGGTGALVGAGAGAVAGTVGAAFTGRREVSLPVESRLTFTLASEVALGTQTQ